MIPCSYYILSVNIRCCHVDASLECLLMVMLGSDILDHIQICDKGFVIVVVIGYGRACN